MAINILLLIAYFFSGWVCLGKDFTKQNDGVIVEYTSVAGKATFKPVLGNLAAGSIWWGLHNVVCGAADPVEKHRVFSGKVADYNIGTPRKGVPIFIAVDDKPPVMVAITDNDGKFSFHIYQASNDSPEKHGYILPKEFKDAFLYVGYVGSLVMPRPERPQIGSLLPSGSGTSQYPITDVLK